MSDKILEKIIKQTDNLTSDEKQDLYDHLIKSLEKTNDSDSGLSAEVKEEKRQLRDKWMKENREKYGGLYVALDGDKLVGTGKNYPEAVEVAKKAGAENAVVDFVRPPDYVGEIGGFE
jgi:hypothetical protein